MRLSEVIQFWLSSKWNIKSINELSQHSGIADILYFIEHGNDSKIIVYHKMVGERGRIAIHCGGNSISEYDWFNQADPDFFASVEKCLKLR